MAEPPPPPSAHAEPWGRWSGDGLTFTVDRASDGQSFLPVPAADQSAQPPEHTLDAPTPAALADNLRQLLTAADPALGCLTPRMRVRLFRHGRELAAPWVTPTRFDEARAHVDALGELLARTPPAPLKDVCAVLVALGHFAEEVRPVLANPAAGARRDWARLLFDNLQTLAQLASRSLEKQTPPAPPPDPVDAALQELAGRHALAGQFRTLLDLARAVRPLCAGRWPEAEAAVQGLHYPAERFRKSVLRAAAVALDEQTRLLRAAGRSLADDLVNKIRAFDALLPGKSSDGPLPPRAPVHLGPEERDRLCQQLRALRELLLAVMREHGGYDEYPVALGDTVAKHGAALEDVTFVATPRHRANVIFQILEPGYVRRREGGQAEVIRSPRVCAAR